MNLGRESEEVEFKETTGDRHQGCESIAAMLNKNGFATVYFGVDDDGTVIGQLCADSTLKELADTIIRDIEPQIIPSLDVLTFEGRQVIKVTASGTLQPYSAYGKYLIRVGAQNRKLARDELVRIVKEKSSSSPWEEELTAHTLADVKADSLKRYYEEAVACGRLEMKSFDEESLLTTLGLLSGGRLKNAGYALFGEGAGISLKCACYAGEEKLTFTDLKLFKGNIYDLTDEAMTYLKTRIDWKMDMSGERRVETPEIPVRALSEMVVNAFAHCDYNSHAEIEIDIHPGKITIFNPGTFPDGLTPYDFINKNVSSIKRNPLILETLFRCKDVEKSGTGFRRMNELCKESDVVWGYESTPYGFYFTFYRKGGQRKDFVRTPKKTGLESLAEQIYLLIKEDPEILKSSLAKETGKSERTIQRHLNILMSRGYLKRVGNNQYGYWKILK